MTNLENGVAHFVHDFAGIDLPLPTVVRAIDLAATPTLVQRFVTSAWSQEVRVLEAAERRTPHEETPRVDVVFGNQRCRSDAVILPVAWRTRSGPWVPPVDADLEFAAFGPDRTHVHLYGRSELPPDAAPASGKASMAQRLTVAVVRHVLTSLTDRVLDLAGQKN